MPEGGRQGELMPERAGRAKPFLIIAPIIAFALLVLAIVVAVAGPPGGGPPDSVSPPNATPSDGPETTAASAGTPSGIRACASADAPSPGELEVLVYFDCGGPPDDPVPVVRPVGTDGAAAQRLRVALQALIAGPTREERQLGLRGFLPPGADDALRAVQIDDRHAIIDFSDALTRGALNSSHNRFIVLGTLGATIRQFPEIASVEFRIAGSCDAFAATFETACTFVLEREHVLGDWVLIGGSIDGERVVTVAAEPITLVVEPDRLSGRAACNVFGASLLMRGSAFAIGAIEASEILCDAAATDAEATYLRALNAVTTAHVDAGDLVLAGPGVTLRYAELSPVLPGA